MIGRFQAYEQAKKENLPPPDWGRQGVLFGLAATFDTPSLEWVATRPEHEELRLKLALVKTTFARFDRELCRQLVYRGWWLAGCSIATFHRDLVDELPEWRPLAEESASHERTASSRKLTPSPPSEKVESTMNVQLRTYSVSDFADDYLGGKPGLDLANVGPASSAVLNWTQSERRTSPLIATVLWRAFLEAGGLDWARVNFADRLPDEPLTIDDVFVIRHPLDGGEPRHDLLVLVANEVDAQGMGIHPPTQLVEAGWEALRPRFVEESDAGAPLGAFAQSPAALVEAAQAQEFGVMFVRSPEMIGTSPPSPAVEVRCPSDAPGFSSAGLVVEREEDAAIGVTVALHAVEETGSSERGTEVFIGERRGTIESADPYSDSCFVRLDDVADISTTPVTGVLSGSSPRVSVNPERFDGRGSGPQGTHVTGWDPEIPIVTKRMQLRVLTEPDTVPGDSGAALIDKDGFVLGLAFERTGYNVRPPFASWIWADSVMRAHKLRLLGVS